MSVMSSRPVLRWTVPAGVLVAVLVGGVISTQLSASASVTLPQRSPAQLLVDVQNAHLTGVSGTVVEQADLGLPALPMGIGGNGGGGGSSSLDSLISGSHTLRVWYSGPDKTRVALLGALGESDIIRNGDDAWIWTSANNTATHTTVAGPARQPAMPTPSTLPGTPEQAAQQALALVGQNSVVSTEPSTTVAGRPAYLLSLTPRDSNSLVAKIRVGIDGARHVPTQFEVFAKGHPDPALSIKFSQVSFSRPDDERFAFTPPPGAKVNNETVRPDQAPHDAAKPATAVIGTGWTSVLASRLPAGTDPLTAGSPAAGTGPDGSNRDGAELQAFVNSLPRVHGSWGSGRVLQSRLFSVLLTDDGRVLVGPVTGARLQQAAADPAAALR